jgi:transcriptional antiterminator RfaH
MPTSPPEWKPVPLFPGYLFMRVDLGAEDSSNWKWTPGLRYIVAYGDWPVPVPDEVIKLIEHKLEELESLDSKPENQFKPGDIVRISSGPFRDLLGVFDGPTKPSARVHVLLTGLSNSVRLRVPAASLDKVSALDQKTAFKRPRRTRGRGRRIK